jgi:hypothetical protein
VSESGATAVTFTLLSWALAWSLAFELWPELRAARLRLRLRQMQMEQNDPELFQALEAAARQAEEFRWLPLLLARERRPERPEQERAAWEIVRHAARGAPWLWLALLSQAGRQRWMRRAWGLIEVRQP